MNIDVLTLFPAMFAGPLDESIIKRARQAGLLDLAIHNLRDYAHDRHKSVDDRPFGGGPGMLLKPEPIFEAVEAIARENTRVVLLSPAGRLFSQSIARELAQVNDLLLISGHYEGFDERIREQLADDELSIRPQRALVDKHARVAFVNESCCPGFRRPRGVKIFSQEER